MRHFGDDIVPGDVFIMNDPFDGGMHLPDIFIFKPLFHGPERLAFACTVCHHTDVGGRIAGSNASDSTEIYAEGLRIAPMKLYEAGQLNQTIMTFIERTCAFPCRCSATCAPSSPPATSPSSSSPRSWPSTARSKRRLCMRETDRLRRTADARRVAPSYLTANGASRTSSTMTASTTGSRSGSSSPSASATITW